MKKLALFFLTDVKKINLSIFYLLRLVIFYKLDGCFLDGLSIFMN
jgi:hypothetical protein